MEAITLNSLSQLEQLYAGTDYKKNNQESNLVMTLDNAKNQALYDTALSIGIKGGLAAQLEKINTILSKRTSYLDKIYNFEPYLIYGRVVPPVITEARNLYNQDGDYAVRLSGALYKIERQAKIVSVAPNWREYLNFPPIENPHNIVPSITPSTTAEKNIWLKGLRQGWKDGSAQANTILNQNFNRLNRDLLGILLFHRFVQEKKVTLPVLAQSKMNSTKNNATLVLNEELLRLTILPDFTDDKQWQTKISPHPKISVKYTFTPIDKVSPSNDYKAINHKNNTDIDKPER